MKKKFSLVAISALCMSLLFGCANGETEKVDSKADSKASDAKVSLKMAVFPADEAVFKKGYETFKQDHPNVEITFETFPQQQYYEKSGCSFPAVKGMIFLPDRWTI